MEDFQQKQVLITGGLGFIGSNLAHRLVGLGANITLVDNLIPEFGGNLFNIHGLEGKIKVNFADVLDPYSMAHLVEGKKYLFNLAGQTSHLDSMEDPFTDLDMNARAQLSVLEACRKYNPDIRIVFASTRQIYGKPQYLPVNEKHPLDPVDINGIHKIAGESYHVLYSNVYGLRSTILRLTNTYGPRMRVKDARQTFLGVWIRAVLEGRPFEVWAGKQLRDFTYVDDVIEAMIMSALNTTAPAQIFNIGGEQVLSLKKLASLLLEVYGAGTYVLRDFPLERKKIDIGDYYADDNLILQTLGWQPEITMKSGLRATLDYYEDNLSHYL